jgi:periplasmic divalent cation tolerance protein
LNHFITGAAKSKPRRTEEAPVAGKTCRSGYAEVEVAIRTRHPYELPEIIAISVTDGFALYVCWIADDTAPT